MSMAFVEKLAKDTGLGMDEAQRRWKKAKAVTEEQTGMTEADGDKYWAYVAGVFKKSVGVMEDALGGYNFRIDLAKADDLDDISEVFRKLFGAPPSHDSPYFKDTFSSVTMKLSDMIPRELPDPERLKKAHALMAAAKKGMFEKRKPIYVADMGNGKYKVLDGNTTLHALLELGETDAVVEVKNRFEKPTNDGYMDVLFVVNVGGHLCELQLNTEAILNAKEKGLGHKIYEVKRQLDPIAKDTELNGDIAYMAMGYSEELRKLSVKYYRNAAMSDSSSSAKSIASDSEMGEALDRILAKLSGSVISTHFSIDLPSIRNNLPQDRSMAKGTSSFSANLKLSESDISYPPLLDASNITRAGKKINGKVLPGRPTRAYLSDDRMLFLQYAVVEAKELVTSHREDMSLSDQFPQELQPRDRTRDAMVLQVERISNKLNPDRMGGSLQASTGAPIVGPDLIVESGNGRTIALNKRYARDEAPEYRAWLKVNATRFGFDKANIDDFERPVLVRIRLSRDVSRVEVAERSNAGDMATMSPAELAQMDSRRLTSDDLDIFRPSDDGNVLSMANRSFISRFMAKLGNQESAGLLTADGQATRQLADRIKAAIFHQAFANDQLLALMAEEADPDLKNVIAALTIAAKAFAKLKILPEAAQAADALTRAVIDAVQLVRQSRSQGMPMAAVLAQMRLFESISEDAKSIALFIDANVRRQARMGAVFRTMAEQLREYFLSLKQGDLFGDRPPQPTVADLLERAERLSEPQRGLFESAGSSVKFKTKKFKLQDSYQFQNIPISVENKAGSVRKGTDPDGHEWKTKMRFDYGYIRRTRGADDEGIDVYVGPDRKAQHVYIVKQHDIEKVKGWGSDTCPKCGEHVHDCACSEFYDEDKVMLGFANKQAAVEAYLTQYDSPLFLGPVSTMTVDGFRSLVTGDEENVEIPLQFVSESAWIGIYQKMIGG
jgi:hypothetical protein